MSTTTHPLQAVLITPYGVTRTVPLDPAESGESIRTLIGCRLFTVVGLGGGLDLYADDESLVTPEPVLNLAATVLAHQYGMQTAIFGTAVVAGVEEETGDTRTLTREQITEVQQAMRHKPSGEVIDRLCETLAPFEAVTAMLRASA